MALGRLNEAMDMQEDSDTEYMHIEYTEADVMYAREHKIPRREILYTNAALEVGMLAGVFPSVDPLIPVKAIPAQKATVQQEILFRKWGTDLKNVTRRQIRENGIIDL